MSPSSADVVLGYLSNQALVLADRSDDVRADTPDAVHRTRVATRRARSLLRTFGSLFGRDETASLRRDLAWHADHLGAPRDAEVLLERLLGLLDALPRDHRLGEFTDRLTAELSARHAEAHARLVASMDDPRYPALRQRLDHFLADPPERSPATRPPAEVLPPLLGKAIGRVSALAERAGDLPDDLTHWHEVRKAAKAARYCAEALKQEFPAAVDTAKGWEQVTEAFGEVQDSVVAEGTLVRISAVAREAGEPIEPYLVLESIELAAREQALDRGRRVLGEALVHAQTWPGLGN